MGSQQWNVGLVGARGHVGAELIALLAEHPHFELSFVSSREMAGQRVVLQGPRATESGLHYESLSAGEVAARSAHAVILALPNGLAAGFVEAIDASCPRTVVVDLSADFRFDDNWRYGLPELARGSGNGDAARRISNPGCYATAMQLALAPVLDQLVAPSQCFGVSGYSGAGTSPSPRNDPALLRDNLMPYALIDHLHEREVARHLGHAVEFVPHVAPHFRGLTVTANLHLRAPTTSESMCAAYESFYAQHPLVRVHEREPWVSHIAGKHHAEIGGFALAADGKRAVVVATLDNLLKGAATQALQNLNLAFGLPVLTGIPTELPA